MHVDVVVLPRDLRPGQLVGRACAVFDVLRATTTMAAALAAGVSEIRLFGDLDSARSAAEAFGGRKLLCGESRCLPPAGFDLGNSPGQFTAIHRGTTLFMCTTNGTRALLAAVEAEVVFPAALVNAAAVAEALMNTGRDITLVCAGTNGEVAGEDMIGAGAVIESLKGSILTDQARKASRSFIAARNDLPGALREFEGGKNVIAAGLEGDIEFASRLNSIDVVGIAGGNPLTVRRLGN